MRRFPLLPVLGVAFVAVVLVLGFQVKDVVSSNDEVEQFQKIEEAYQYILRGYVERVDAEKLSEDAIEGMLSGLDPHSVYISAREMERVREEFNSTFEGIGIYFEIAEGESGRDTLMVLMPIAGGPSEEAGLQAGDRIVQIDDTTAIGFTSQEVQKYLKGPKGTTVDLKVVRPGYEELLAFTIERDQIPIETVLAAYMMDSETGYVKLQRFARTSHQEVVDAIRNLKGEGMERLVLDLRGNAGGLLEQAHEIADEFLAEDQMIVYTDSRYPENRRRYFASEGGVFEDGALIVLINENSASASEIVAGAIQDHDRGLIVGRRSFGKGLVQQQFPLHDNSVIQITVSRYYTPVGRLIQTPYYNGESDKEYFESKLALRKELEQELTPEGGMVNADAYASELPDSIKYQTDAGRTVYGGGGILPDYIVPIDSLSPALRTIRGKGLETEFARSYVGSHLRDTWEGRREAFLSGYEVSDDVMNAFLDYVREQGVQIVDVRPETETESGDVLVRSEVEASRDKISGLLKANFARRLFGLSAEIEAIGAIDPELTEARSLWGTATELASLGR